MDFDKAKTTYRKNAFIQKNMADILISILIKNCGKNYDKIFEIGAGTGFLTDKIRANLIYKEIILNDLSENYTNFKPDKYIKGDILKITPPDNCDLIISNACFQWIMDYNKLFSKLHNLLKSGGVLAFSTFGSKNFKQIKDISGAGLDYPNLEDFIKNAGLQIIYFEENLETMYFKGVEEVLKHIKYTGVKTENRIWKKSDLIEFKNKYKMKYKDDMGFELTYHPLYFILRA